MATLSPTDAQVTEVLKGVRRLLGHRSRWTTTYLAVDQRGWPVPLYDARAVRWCVLGAIWKVLGPSYDGAFDLHQACITTLTTAGATLGYHVDLSVANDQEGYDAVIAMLDEAIRQK